MNDSIKIEDRNDEFITARQRNDNCILLQCSFIAKFIIKISRNNDTLYSKIQSRKIEIREENMHYKSWKWEIGRKNRANRFK